jgi:predicted phosphoribosyltransferase
MSTPLFEDRSDAGRRLAELLRAYEGTPGLLVLALPRGGVPVAFEVARSLHAPLDIFLVRKLGVPGHEELAMGAIASGGTMVLNDDVIRMAGITPDMIERTAEREWRELERREECYRGARQRPSLRDATVILVDDGLATGSTMRAAAHALRQEGPAQVIIAVPVASPETCHAFREEVDNIICAVTPEPFYGVGAWYADFSQTSDDEVQTLLRRAATAQRSD